MLEVSLEDPRIRAHDLHLWADYLELCCLASKDGEANAEEILREFWRLGSGIATIVDAEPDEVDDFADMELAAPEMTDKAAVRVRDLFAHLSVRQSLFAGAYPFEVLADDATLRLRDTSGFDKQLYVFLLLASNLRFLDGRTMQDVTHDFESLCADRFASLWPRFEVRLFGTSHHPTLTGYSGNKPSRIGQLATDIYANVLIKDGALPRTGVGDAGLDIVSWLPIDEAPYMPLFFAQCGCTADVEEMLCKQNSSSLERWRGNLQHIWSYNFMFTPVCYRDAEGLWPMPNEIRSAFFDRVRLLRISDDLSDEDSGLFSSWEFVQSVLTRPV